MARLASLLTSVAAAFVVASTAVVPAHAQVDADRTDALIAEEARPTRSDPPKPKIVSPTPPRALSVDAAMPVSVVAIAVEGITVLRAEDFAEAIRPFAGRTLLVEDQTRLLQAIVDVARRADFPLATAIIPRQPADGGVLRIMVEEGRVDGVRLIGPRHPLAEKMLNTLADGLPLTGARLARVLRVVESLPGVRLGRPQLLKENALNVLSATIEARATEALLALDNWGTETLGPVLARGRAELRSALTSGDEITVSATTSPLDPNEYVNVQARYVLPLGTDGTRIAAEASVARVRGTLSDGRGRYQGNGFRVETNLSHPLVLGRTSRLTASLAAGLRDVETIQDGVLVRSDRVSLLTGQLSGYARVGSGYLSGRFAIVHGPGWFGATRAGDPVASRTDGSARFTKAEARAALTTRLVGPISLAFDAEGQVASRPLLSGDEFGIGGASFGRGYDLREASGDNALAGSAEVRVDLAALGLGIERIEVYGYGDAAKVWDIGRADGSDTLYSSGGGLRASLTERFGLGVEVGVPIGDDRRARGSFTSWVRF